jgi:ABC-type branched-subunit amino acid transport system substrate-binding protein
MNRRWPACFLLLLLAAGCGSVKPVPVSREIVVVGVLGIAQGGESQESQLRGVQVAVAEYNARSDSHFRAILKKADTKGSSDGAKQAADSLAKTDRLVGVVGPLNAGEGAAAASVLEGAGIPYLVPIGDPAVPPPGGKFFRRLVPNPAQEAAALAREAARRVSGGIAIVRDSNDLGSAFETGAMQALEAIKRPPVKLDEIEPKQNLGGLAYSIIRAPPDAILYGGSGEQGKALVDALRQAGFRGLVVTSHQVMQINPQGLGGSGIISSSLLADPSDPSLSDFAKAYKDRFSSDPPPGALELYEGTFMLLDAIEEVGGKPAAVAEFLRQNRGFRGDSKEYRYDPSGELIKPPVWLYESTASSWRLSGRSDLVGGGGRR